MNALSKLFVGMSPHMKINENRGYDLVLRNLEHKHHSIQAIHNPCVVIIAKYNLCFEEMFFV